MTLGSILDSIEQLNADDVVFAEKPWRLDSRAEIGQLDQGFRVPRSIRAAGLDYFLEVALAKEVLEVFGATPPAARERIDLLMFYAENDAYPEWVYQR